MLSCSTPLNTLCQNKPWPGAWRYGCCRRRDKQQSVHTRWMVNSYSTLRQHSQSERQVVHRTAAGNTAALSVRCDLKSTSKSSGGYVKITTVLPRFVENSSSTFAISAQV